MLLLGDAEEAWRGGRWRRHRSATSKQAAGNIATKTHRTAFTTIGYIGAERGVGDDDGRRQRSLQRSSRGNRSRSAQTLLRIRPRSTGTGSDAQVLVTV